MLRFTYYAHWMAGGVNARKRYGLQKYRFPITDTPLSLSLLSTFPPFFQLSVSVCILHNEGYRNNTSTIHGRRYAFPLSLSVFVPLCSSSIHLSPSISIHLSRYVILFHSSLTIVPLPILFLSLYLGRFQPMLASLASSAPSLSSSLSLPFFCEYTMHVYHTGPRVKVHRPNKPRTDRLALQPPPTPVFPSHCSPVDSLRSSSRYNAHHACLCLSSSFSTLLFDDVVFIPLVRWLPSSFARRLINH